MMQVLEVLIDSLRQGPQPLVHGPAPVCGMPETGPRKQVKLRDAGNTRNHGPSNLWKTLSPGNLSLVAKKLGAADLRDEIFLILIYFDMVYNVLLTHITHVKIKPKCLFFRKAEI